MLIPKTTQLRMKRATNGMLLSRAAVGWQRPLVSKAEDHEPTIIALLAERCARAVDSRSGIRQHLLYLATA